jgi:hypothetical protein
MQHIVFIPFAVFCAVTGISWATAITIDLRERAATRRAMLKLLAAPAATPAPRPKFRPQVIQGGLATAPAATVYFRAGETPLRSASRTAARPYRAARLHGG